MQCAARSAASTMLSPSSQVTRFVQILLASQHGLIPHMHNDACVETLHARSSLFSDIAEEVRDQVCVPDEVVVSKQ